MEFSIAAATESGGGVRVASFGSGNEGGRLQAVRGAGRNQSASPARVRAVRSQINRASITRAQRRRLLQEIDDNTTRRGNIRTGILADIQADLRDLS
jgi:hypothetical protein